MSSSSSPTELNFVRVGDVWCRRSGIQRCEASGDRTIVYSVGITNLAASHLGTIGFIDAVRVGDILIPHRPFAMVEGKHGRNILESPLSGEVAGVNATVVKNPSVLEVDAEQNWIVQLEVVVDDGEADTVGYEWRELYNYSNNNNNNNNTTPT